MTWRRFATVWLIALALLAGCNPFRRERQPKVPPVVEPPPPAPMPEARRPPEPAAHEYPPPPDVQPEWTAESTPRPPVPAETAVAPPPRAPAPRETVKPEATPPSQPPPVQVPQLTQLLTPEEEKRYNDEIDDALGRVRRNLEILHGRSLNEEQQAILERINAFEGQTQETRRIDLVTARSLAQRADLLARDLERTTR
ncbi:MAG: hypothetical protein KIT09_34630 [Bryobacteraceae bacterium]|nr:hypothetical protein [Bryobacteraceae bacterium]